MRPLRYSLDEYATHCPVCDEPVTLIVESFPAEPTAGVRRPYEILTLTGHPCEVDQETLVELWECAPSAPRSR